VNKLSSSRSQNSLEKFVVRSSDIGSINTCDFCHRILQLYICKKEKLLRDDKEATILLNKLSLKDYSKWTSDELFIFIDYFSYNIPSIDLVNRIGNKSISKALKPKVYRYYFGYYPVSDALKFKSFAESKKELSETKKNFIIYNKTNPLSIKITDHSINNDEINNKGSFISLNLSKFKDMKKVYSKEKSNKYFKTTAKFSH